ncbi:unnamed protein product [Owenia fusiformis]|uniref:Uncharacterized protein n=1 Tax=Owenia fusiformis TaxID=6347 RepID=A0A8S4PNG2_OWEFU|nr:unnamed protein product [Owenia fusiformis]
MSHDSSFRALVQSCASYGDYWLDINGIRPDSSPRLHVCPSLQEYNSYSHGRLDVRRSRILDDRTNSVRSTGTERTLVVRSHCDWKHIMLCLGDPMCAPD